MTAAQDEGKGFAGRTGWGVFLFRIWTTDKSSGGIVSYHRKVKNNQNLVIYKKNVYLCGVKQLSNEYRRLLEHVIRACRSYPL